MYLYKPGVYVVNVQKSGSMLNFSVNLKVRNSPNSSEYFGTCADLAAIARDASEDFRYKRGSWGEPTD